MKLRSGTKVALALATLLPLVYGFAFMSWWMRIVLTWDMSSNVPFQAMTKAMPVQMGFLLYGFALIGVYVYLAVKMSHTPQERLAWILMVVLASNIGQFVFFFVKVWPGHDGLDFSEAFAPGSRLQPQPIEWFYMDGPRQVGPLSRDSMDTLERSGVISVETLVWTRGMADWAPLESTRPHRRLTIDELPNEW